MREREKRKDECYQETISFSTLFVRPAIQEEEKRRNTWNRRKEKRFQIGEEMFHSTSGCPVVQIKGRSASIPGYLNEREQLTDVIHNFSL